MQLPEIDFSSLEFKEIGSWPLILRIAVTIGVCICTLIIMYFLLFAPEIANLEAADKKLDDKSTEFKDQYTQAVNLDGYKKQMQDMQSAYQDYIKQLPSSSNIPELIDSLTKIGERNGLKINSIKIGDPKLISGFYMALPLNLSIIGGYHNIGLFVNETAKLSRIVTLHDFNIKAAADNASGVLQMDMQAQTYWLASPAEIETQTPKDTGKKSTKGRATKGKKDAASAAPGTPATPPGVPTAPGAPGKGALPAPQVE